MKRIHKITLAGLAVAALTVTTAMSVPSFAQQMKEQTVTVGGAPMYPSKNIVQNAVNSKDHTTLVAAVKAAGLVETLSGTGPFTVFAPVNRAFERLPKGTVPTLLRPENKSTLTGVLTYHVIAGKYSAADFKGMVERMGGRTTLKTVQGGELTISEAGRNRLQITDAKGDVATITIPDVN